VKGNPLGFNIRSQELIQQANNMLAELLFEKSEEYAIIEKCRTDFLKFREYVCGQETYEHMMVWHRELNTGGDSRYLRGIAGDDVSILSFRNSGKSTFLLQWVAWIIGTHAAPNVGISLKILYISYMSDVAAGKSRQIQQIIQSDRYQKVFPWIRPSKTKWAESEWKFDFVHANLNYMQEDYTLACSGLAGSINSRRAHILCFDDILKSRVDAESKPIQEKMLSNLNSIVRFTRFAGSRAVNLGTRMAKTDIYTKAFTAPKWKIITQQALITDKYGNEKSAWEPVDDNSPGIPLAMLLEERANDEESFILQRQNLIPETTRTSIPEHEIIYDFMPETLEKIVIGLDLAHGIKNSNDYTGIVIAGYSSSSVLHPSHPRRSGNGIYWIIAAWQEKIQGNKKKLELIHELWDRWKYLLPTTNIYNYKTDEDESHPKVHAEIWLDKNALALDFEGDWLEYIAEQQKINNDFAPTQLIPLAASGRGDKINRLMRHSFLFSRGDIIFNKFSDTLPDGKDSIGELIQQITDCDPTESNDLLDGLDLALTGLRQFCGSVDSYHA
jgi:hypothetical protein